MIENLTVGLQSDINMNRWWENTAVSFLDKLSAFAKQSPYVVISGGSNTVIILLKNVLKIVYIITHYYSAQMLVVGQLVPLSTHFGSVIKCVLTTAG